VVLLARASRRPSHPSPALIAPPTIEHNIGLAVGNLHGDTKLELRVIRQPLRCFHLDAAIDPCEEE
jgi:hypothetical protein